MLHKAVIKKYKKLLTANRPKSLFLYDKKSPADDFITRTLTAELLNILEVTSVPINPKQNWKF